MRATYLGRLLPYVGLLLAPTLASAATAEHERHGFDYSLLFWQAANLAALAALLIWLLRKPLADFLQRRRSTVEHQMIEAQALKEEAEARYAEYEAKLAQLDEELERLRTEMVRAGEAERDRLVDEAKAAADRMARDTAFIVEQQSKQLALEMRREAAEAAVRAAETLLRDKLTTADHERLAKEYLARIQSVGGLEETPATSSPKRAALPQERA